MIQSWRNMAFCFFLMMVFPGSFLFSQNRQAVLIRGNSWKTENSLFSSAVTTTLFGEYSTEAPAAGSGSSGGLFFVRVCGDKLLFSESAWQPWPGNNSFLSREEESGLFIGYQFAGGPDLGAWNIVFQFPNSGGFDNAEINRLIEAWTSRFRYFLSLVRVPSDMSLPAVFSF